MNLLGINQKFCILAALEGEKIYKQVSVCKIVGSVVGRLRWYGYVMRRDQEYVEKKMMEMELPGKRRRGRPKRRFLDVVKEDMGEVGVKETDVEDRKM